jgi:hypothetical protein
MRSQRAVGHDGPFLFAAHINATHTTGSHYKILFGVALCYLLPELPAATARS